MRAEWLFALEMNRQAQDTAAMYKSRVQDIEHKLGDYSYSLKHDFERVMRACHTINGKKHHVMHPNDVKLGDHVDDSDTPVHLPPSPDLQDSNTDSGTDSSSLQTDNGGSEADSASSCHGSPSHRTNKLAPCSKSNLMENDITEALITSR